MAIYKVGVAGGGAMGSGIAGLVARCKMPVVVREASPELAERARVKIYGMFDRWSAKAGVSADVWKSLVQVTDSWNGFEDVDLFIEAVTENLNVKIEIFCAADTNLPSTAILASNTSSLSISEIAKFTNRPNKVIGMHFFNPAYKMPLVEMVLAHDTSKETADEVREFSENTLRKNVISVKECPGFLVNRLLMSYLNEAALLLTQTRIKAEELDAVAKEFGWPVGPFMLMDMVGMDVGTSVAQVLHKGYGDRMLPAPMMKLLMDEKRIGQKVGIGFYSYATDGEPIEQLVDRHFPPENRVPISSEEAFERMMLNMVNEAFRCLEESVASAEDIETGCLMGISFPMTRGGPLHWAESVGLDKIAQKLSVFASAQGSRFTPATLLRKHVEDHSTVFEKDAF